MWRQHRIPIVTQLNSNTRWGWLRDSRKKCNAHDADWLTDLEFHGGLLWCDCCPLWAQRCWFETRAAKDRLLKKPSTRLCWKFNVARLKVGVEADVHICYFFVTKIRWLSHIFSEFLHTHQRETNGIKRIPENLASILSCQRKWQSLAFPPRPSHCCLEKYRLLGN